MPKLEAQKTTPEQLARNTKWTTDRAKKESEQAVLKELAKKSPQRWGELLKNTKLSSRTLKNALERMQEKQLICRQVEQGKEYPPPVLYGLSKKGEEITGPILFATYVKNSILRPAKEEITLLASKTQPKFEDAPLEKGTSLMGRLKPEAKDEKERLAAIGRRLGAFYLFSLLKALEDRNYDWMPEAKQLLEYDHTVEAALGFGTPEYKYKKILVKDKVKPSKQLIADLVIFTSPLVVPNKEEIRRTRELLKQAFPEESEFLRSIEGFSGFAKDFERKQPRHDKCVDKRPS